MRTRQLWIVLAVILTLILVQLSCDTGSLVDQVEQAQQQVETQVADQVEQQTGGSDPEATAVVVLPEPTLSFDVPDPQSGTGNLVGRIVFNRTPVAAAEVQLCEEFGMFSGCEGINYSDQTDENGYYLFTNVTPGDYALAVHAIDADTWLFVTEGLGFSADKYTVTADETLTIGSQSIYKFDLVQTYPAEDATIQEGQPTLTWQAYPGADHYEVYLNPDRGAVVFVGDEVDEAQITPPQPLLNCEFTWQIEAFNAAGDKLAEPENYGHFTVTGQQYSCDVPLISPQDGASLAGSGLELSWEAHPLAEYYNVHIWDKDYTDLLGGPRVDGTTYTVDQVLPAGEYSWYVTAYDSGDDEIARSDFYDFSVP